MTKSKSSKFTSKQNRKYLNNMVIQDYKNIIKSDAYYSFDVKLLLITTISLNNLRKKDIMRIKKL